MQVPIGLEDEFQGLVDLVQLKAYYFRGSSGYVSFCQDTYHIVHLVCFLKKKSYIDCFIYIDSCCREEVVTEDIPANMEDIVTQKRKELIEAISEVDEKLAESYINDEPITSADLEVCIFNLLLDKMITHL